MKVFLNAVKIQRKLARWTGKCALVPVRKDLVTGALQSLARLSPYMIVLRASVWDEEELSAKNISILTVDGEADIGQQVEHILFNRQSFRPESMLSLEASNTAVLLFIPDDMSARSMFTNPLLTRVPSGFSLEGVEKTEDGIYYPVYNKGLLPVKRFRRESKPYAVVTDWDGFGDAVMIYQQIQAFVDRYKVIGREVHVITYRKLVDFLKYCLRDCEIYATIEPGLYSPEPLLISGVYDKVFHTSARLPESMKHCTELCAEALGQENCILFEPDNFPFRPLPESVLQLLADLRKGCSNLVGFQYCTEDEERSWPFECAQSFVEQCARAGYAVVNLTPGPVPAGAVDVSYLSIVELFSVIQRIDAVVAIDSISGHIAGALGTPNITIWGKNYPHLTDPRDNGGKNFSFRSMSMNYSLVPTDAATSSISPDLVFCRLNQILNKEIVLDRRRITGEDTLNGLHVEWVARS